MIKPAFKCNEWKKYTYPSIINQFPDDYQNLTYVEACVGSGAVFLNKKPSVEEIINDIDPTIVAIWKCLRDRSKDFINQVCSSKVSEELFNTLKTKENTNNFDLGVSDYLIRKMSKNEAKQEFVKKITKPSKENLLSISSRLNNTIILKQNMVEIIQLWNNSNVFIYIDPPIMPGSRVKETDSLEIEMTTDDHVDYLHKIKDTKAKVLISSHPNNVYNKHLKSWKCTKIETADKKVECLWSNY